MEEPKPTYGNGNNPQHQQPYQQPYEQQYQQPPPNYGQNFGQNGPAPPIPGNKPTFEQSFKLEGPKWNDVWAGILFLITFAGYVAVSGIVLQGYASTKGYNGGSIYGGNNTFGLSTNTLVLFAFVLVVALVLSLAYFFLARAFTKQFIWITGILHIVFGIGTAIVYFARHYYSAAIVFLVFSIFSIICFVSWIPRIPFSVVMLQTSIDVARKHGHVFLVSLIGGVVSIAFAAWFSATLVGVYVKYMPGNNPACTEGAGNCSSAKVIGLTVFITFAGYWITEWIKNTMHTTVAGVYGSWYFCAGKPGGMPKGSTRGAFRRATTYSFGSISLGSLLVALINMLRQAASIAQRQEAAEGNIVGSILFCILGCFIGILDWAVQFLNRYAFSYIALYGKAYIPAAKDTWGLIKNRGIDALINDCLIGPVLTMGSAFVAYLCSFLAYLYLDFTKPAYNQDNKYTPVVMAFAFLIGLQSCNIFMTPISSGVDTIFVAAAWDPQVLMRDHPDLWAKIVSVYPQVQQAVHV
ncbi:DUF580-domain-containing protein [Xylona heveae TC161]|uniref:Protein PNS1 n=1 Tax=Xylona heveae (strain CBS 132557 / TC161) TaxID=1328760 RepID=A0A165IVC2_XYLHT|nr:DUF580-domain-containing protein [Xylona heveae TC161]KZF25440.1 DUF580-domain-containing protein [Xylona heveae TC161]